jgi:hypothetical protein
MATQTDFWGDISPAEPVRTPVAILREQAALLGSKTQNVVEAKVSTIAGERFFHSFNLVVPALGNYAYQLFVIGTGVSPYPASVVHSDLKFETEQEFTDWLKAKLSSPETKKVIANLLAQATT